MQLKADIFIGDFKVVYIDTILKVTSRGNRIKIYVVSFRTIEADKKGKTLLHLAENR